MSSCSELATQACQQCSRSKRKCARQLPSCSACLRLARTCTYPTQRKTYTYAKSESSSASGPAVALFPDNFFLDPEFLEPLRDANIQSTCPVPRDVSQVLEGQVELICNHYFSTVDTWLPFLSQKRFLQVRRDGFVPADADTALLLLCMKLSLDSSHIEERTSARTTLYTSARSFANVMEETNPLSLSVIQALSLIALYEAGHAIFPAAYLTLGRASRLGLLSSLHDRTNTSTQLFQTPSMWTNWEEQRRTWWAVSILERYINLGPTGRPHATPEPSQGSLLPTTEAHWHAGSIGTTHAVYISGFTSLDIGPFARVCQASHILGRVLNHRNTLKTVANKQMLLIEALQLNATLTALDKHLARAMDEEPTSDITTVDVALCTSARITLYQMYSCNLPDVVSERLEEESHLQAVSIEGITQIIGVRSRAIASCVLAEGATNLNATSPLVLKCLYETASECQWLMREGNMVEGVEETSRLTVEALTVLARRWVVADRYLNLLRRSDNR